MPELNVTIDISRWQPNVDFARVKADGIQAVIIKATEGMNYVDPMFHKHHRGAKNVNMKIGVYHFGTASDPIGQADDFLETVNPDANTLLVLDFERNTNPRGTQMTLVGARKFVTYIKAKTGRWPVFYCGHFFADLMGSKNDPVFSQCPLWIAAYIRAPKIQASWNDWTLWQYTDGKFGNQPRRVDGIGGCDRSIFNGDQAELDAFWKSGL